MINKWEYLGDGVYVKPDQFGLWIHANSHDEPTDKIYFEWSVLASFLKLKEVKQIIAHEAAHKAVLSQRH